VGIAENKGLTESQGVLLIDDNAIQAATRQAILRRAGIFAIAALNPRRALEQFEHDEFPARIGVVLTDHIMPGMNGAQFVRELRKTHPTLPVLVISGLDEARSEYDGLDVVFLLKPLPPEELLANVRGLLAISPSAAKESPAAGNETGSTTWPPHEPALKCA
jgi:DNA-binding response OmpR family regulator